MACAPRVGAGPADPRFVDENFRFYGSALTGAQELRPRWKRCVQYTHSALGEDFGKGFVKDAFGPQGKADMMNMILELKSALERDSTS